MRTVSVVVMGLIYIAAGVVHLARPDIYRPIMPPYLPAPDLLILLSGLAQIALGLGVLVPRTRRWAGWGLIALLVAVFPANLYMAQSQAAQWPNIPAWILWARLPLQAGLIYWARAATRSRSNSSAT